MDGLEKDIDFGIYDFGKVRTLEDYERYAGISFKKRAVQKYTTENKFAPNPPLYGEEFEKSFMTIFKHCIDIHKDRFNKDEDYDFWAVIFENDNGAQIFRKDATESEIRGFITTADDWVKIWREFNVEERPTKWIVWPHSKTNGWLDKIEGKL